MKKVLLILGVLALVLGASSLSAATNWHGKFWGDSEGIWKGTLYDNEQDPPIFKGKWACEETAEEGTLYAVLDYAGHGIFKIVKGTIYDINGNLIGAWDGYFDQNIKPGYAEGEWKTFDDPDAIHYGKWQGKRILFEEE
ncbi:hypothetical protein GX441_12230 [bacterium]|nr:hypothetical protein [bacterium]